MQNYCKVCHDTKGLRYRRLKAEQRKLENAAKLNWPDLRPYIWIDKSGRARCSRVITGEPGQKFVCSQCWHVGGQRDFNKKSAHRVSTYCKGCISEKNHNLHKRKRGEKAIAYSAKQDAALLAARRRLELEELEVQLRVARIEQGYDW